jgi:predicted RNase H-like HicB family nuclease
VVSGVKDVKAMKFLVTLAPGEDGWIVAECPALPGCLSQGRTRDEALSNIREAIQAALLTRREAGIEDSLQIAEVEVAMPVE